MPRAMGMGCHRMGVRRQAVPSRELKEALRCWVERKVRPVLWKDRLHLAGEMWRRRRGDEAVDGRGRWRKAGLADMVEMA